MSDTLSEQLNFRVNNYRILLGNSLNVVQMKAHGFEKAGFWTRLLLKHRKGEILFWSKNCEFTYLNSAENTIYPVVDKSKKDNTIFGTTAYLWYRNNTFSKFGFQVMQNQSVIATTLFEEIEEKIIKSIGKADTFSRNLKTWEMKNQKLVLEIPFQTRYGYLHLMFRE